MTARHSIQWISVQTSQTISTSFTASSIGCLFPNYVIQFVHHRFMHHISVMVLSGVLWQAHDTGRIQAWGYVNCEFLWQGTVSSSKIIYVQGIEVHFHCSIFQPIMCILKSALSSHCVARAITWVTIQPCRCQTPRAYFNPICHCHVAMEPAQWLVIWATTPMMSYWGNTHSWSFIHQHLK